MLKSQDEKHPKGEMGRALFTCSVHQITGCHDSETAQRGPSHSIFLDHSSAAFEPPMRSRQSCTRVPRSIHLTWTCAPIDADKVWDMLLAGTTAYLLINNSAIQQTEKMSETCLCFKLNWIVFFFSDSQIWPNEGWKGGHVSEHGSCWVWIWLGSNFNQVHPKKLAEG